MAALFGKKNDEQATDAQQTAQAPAATHGGAMNLEAVLRNPRITEKATIGTHDRVYVFDIAPETNKRAVKQAMKAVYNVEPVKVNVVTVPSKNVRSMRTGIKGVKSGGKKAYVYLKSGDSISIM